MIKIGIDCHNLERERTGVGRYLWNLLKEWSRQNFVYNSHDRENCIQFFLYFKNKIPQDLSDLLKDSNLPFLCDSVKTVKVKNVVADSCMWNFRVLDSRSNALFKHWALSRAARRDKVDILFCPDYVLPLFLDSRIKTAVTIHDIMYEARPTEYSWPSWKDKILLKWASKQSAKYADIVFVPSQFTKSEILKYYRINPEKTVVTPLAPDPIFQKRKFNDGEWDALEKSCGVGYKKYIFFVGSIFNRRFLPQKIQAFTQFAKKHPEFKFLIVGKNHTKPYQDIAKLAAQANFELGRESVVWREFVSDEELVYLYNGAFATLWLSSYEGFGLPVLESMACGTPVITCRAGSLPEVAGDAAVYIEQLEDPHIADVLRNLANNGAYYNALVSKGILRTAKFSWQETARVSIDNTISLL